MDRVSAFEAGDGGSTPPGGTIWETAKLLGAALATEFTLSEVEGPPEASAAKRIVAQHYYICYTFLSSMVINRKTSDNYNFFIKTDTSTYKGEWIAIAGRRILAHGKDAEEVYKKAKKKAPTKNISLAKAPDEQMLVLKFFYDRIRV